VRPRVYIAKKKVDKASSFQEHFLGVEDE
jgi:hypothetical protein